MSKKVLEQAIELLKHIKENPEAIKKLEELAKSAQKDSQSKPVFSEKILKPSDKEAVVLNPNVKKPLANAEDSKQVEMEMSPEDRSKKRVGELAKRIKACIEKMQMDKIQKESMDKDDKPHQSGTPEDKAHDVAEEGESVKQALEGLKDKGADSKEEMLSHLRTLKDKSQLRSEKNKEAGKESHEKSELQKESSKSVHGIPGKNRPLHSRGIHETVRVSSPKFGGEAKEKSLAGLKVRRGDISGAKQAHKEIIEELKSNRSAKLPKSELEKQLMSPPLGMSEKKEIKKASSHEKGINKPANFQLFRPGVSFAGISTRSAKINKEKGASNRQNLNEAKDRHKEVISELKEMKKPNLPKSEIYYRDLVKSELEKKDDKSSRLLGQLESENVSPTPQGKRYFRALRGLKGFGHEHKGVGRKISVDPKRNPVDAAREHKSKLEEIKESSSPSLPKSEMEKRCWEGYEPTPGKKAYSKGSCRPIKKKGLDKAQPEAVPTTKIIPPVIPSGSGNNGNKPKKPIKKPLMNSEKLGKTQKVLVGGRIIYTDRAPEGGHVIAYKIKEKAKSRAKRKPKKTQVKKSEQYYIDLIKKVLDN